MRLLGIVIAITLFAPAAARLVTAQEVEVAAAVAFTEGPTVDRDGNVYFTEVVSQRIMPSR